MSLNIKLGIVSQSSLLRESLRGLFRTRKDLTIASSVPASDYGRLAAATPDVVLVQHDRSTGGPIRELSAALPSTKLIVIDVEPAELDVVGCLKYGVAGFTLKDALAEDLVDAIRAVAVGGRVMPPIVTDRLCIQLSQIGRRSNDNLSMCTEELTLRERDVVNFVLDGLSNKEIADQMNISTCTVKSHMHNIFEKLKISSRIHLINYSSRHDRPTYLTRAIGVNK